MRIGFRILISLAAAFLLAACAPPSDRADLVFINSAEVETLDPAMITDQVSMRLGESLFEGLCRLNAQGKAEPGMAERWEASADKKRYTFFLRKDVRWSNGDPVTAQDFVKSWERVLNPGTGADYAPQLFPLVNARAYNEGKIKDFAQVGVRAVDDRTLETTLENPIPYWIDLCAFQTLSPVHLPTLEKHGSAWMKPVRLVGNGPFLLESWLLDDHIRLKKNPGYWDAANTKLNTVDVMPIADANTALNYFMTGQADLVMDKGMVPVSLVDKLRQQTWFRTGPFLGTWFIRFNVTKAPFTDPLVRRAFALAVDRKRIVEKITRLGEQPATSLTPPGAGQNYQPPPGPEFNPKLAQELLAQAGFPGGRGLPRMEYLYLPLGVEKNIAVELQSMWKENLGVEVSLTKQEQKIWLSSMRELSYQICRSSWVGDYNDPNTFLECFTIGNGNNRTSWESKRYDELIAAAASEADIAKRHAIFSEAEKLLITEGAPIIPVYHYVGVQFRRDGLKGVENNLIDDHPFRAMYWKK
ncbi:MAG: peptide ABC transporter substrate-binding protein [Verrucomicrobia bacterium]|nr:peptide ABC transporter substrate-binding protein [Verrucomicrobiota bacterium]